MQLKQLFMIVLKHFLNYLETDVIRSALLAGAEKFNVHDVN